METDEKLLKYLEVISQRVTHHHNSLWEEEKHYSWWIYIILAGLIYIFFTKASHIDNVLRLIIMLAGCSFGIYISRVAYRVIRRESEDFHEARQVFSRVVCALGLHSRMMPRSERRFRIFAFVRLRANKRTWRDLICAFLRSEMRTLRKRSIRSFPTSGRREMAIERAEFGIRDIFQLTFVVTQILFISLMVASVIRFLIQVSGQ